VVGTSVIVTPIAPAPVAPALVVEEQNGVVTFASAPTAGSYTITYSHVLLLDSTIQDFIDIEGEDSDIRLVAADALDAIASSQALIQKKIKLLDLSTDGPALAKALREHAIMLRKQSLFPDYDEPLFDIAEQVNTEAGWREQIMKDFLRTT
jgi:phage terminase large subunit-like protein